MLKIRLSRTGKRTQPSFRIVVQEHTAPIKGKFIVVLGHYHPALKSKDFSVDTEKVKQWISKGAKPSPTVANLLKKYGGMEGMDKYFTAPNKKRKKKSEKAEKSAAPAAQKAVAVSKEAALKTETTTPAKVEALAPEQPTADQSK